MYINKEAITRLHVVVWGNSLRLRVTGIYSDMNHISALLDDTHVNHDVPETSIPHLPDRHTLKPLQLPLQVTLDFPALDVASWLPGGFGVTLPSY